ncbi:choice-of-anchor I family protein [Lysinibacillus sp. KU-BSD001]|uniref:choice-of-anchor I family protein n=1 Tax=Lysinibacillus sp. KU-BSD001 TaxID=3141328 RepID=UPI0036E704B6
MGKYVFSKATFALSLTGAAIIVPTVGAEATELTYKLSLDARYDSGVQNEDGGTTEIVTYNKHNHATYLVNGETKKVEAVSLNYQNDKVFALKPFLSIDIAELIQTVDASFQYGDLTSIAVHPNENVIVASVQAEDYNEDGYAVFLTGEGALLNLVKVGKQPDNITFSPDGKKVLLANEGEPRKGYGQHIIDPQGSVSIIDLSNGLKTLQAQSVTFEGFDQAEKRMELVKNNVLLKKETAPSVDLEPEYISVSEDSQFAYVAMQENNAIATINLTSNEVISIDGLGFKDFSVQGNEIDVRKDDQAQLQNENYFGIYMPDGIATYSVNGKNYIVTANEGDGREWGAEDSPNFHLNEKEIEIDGNEIVFYDTTSYDGFEKEKEYIFGARSFSIFDADTMELVYDSGSDFERITAKAFPEYFNSSNDKVKLDNRSGKKGPEPEDVKVGNIGEEVFAFVGLERIGGVMMYNITDPANATFVDYLNLRDFSKDIAGDVSPEGLAFVPGDHPQLIVGHEVSGTVTVLNLLAKEEVLYQDIENHSAKEAIIKVTEANLFKGVNATTFAPNNNFTRGQAATVLHRLAGEPKTSDHTSSFKDVKSSDHYAQAISWAVDNKLIASLNNQSFDPNKPITREQFAVAMYAYLRSTDYVFENEEHVVYVDDAKISAEAKNAIYALQSAGIMSGNDHNFEPQQPLTRAQAATVFAKLF